MHSKKQFENEIKFIMGMQLLQVATLVIMGITVGCFSP
jgi:hypothetical protein